MSDGDREISSLAPQELRPEPVPQPTELDESDETNPTEEQLNRMALIAGALGILVAVAIFIGIFYLL